MNTFQCQQLLPYTSQGRLRCVVVLPVASLNQLAVHRDEDVLWPGRFALRVLVQKLLVLDAWSLAPRGTQAFLPCPVRLVPAWTFEKAVSLDSSAPVSAYGGKIMRKTSTTTVPSGYHLVLFAARSCAFSVEGGASGITSGMMRVKVQKAQRNQTQKANMLPEVYLLGKLFATRAGFCSYFTHAFCTASLEK